VKRFVVLALWAACAALAQPALPVVEANVATLAEVERIKGVGTTLAANILEARDKGAFRDWADLIQRVKGIGAGSAARLSAQGLRVNGAAFPTPGAAASATGPGS
jgi:competence protein ComEA